MNVTVNQSNGGKGKGNRKNKVVINEKTQSSWMDFFNSAWTWVVGILTVLAALGISVAINKPDQTKIDFENSKNLSAKLNDFKHSLHKRDSIVAANERAKLQSKPVVVQPKTSIRGNNNQIGNNNKIHNGDIINNNFIGSERIFTEADKTELLAKIESTYRQQGVAAPTKNFGIYMDAINNSARFADGVKKYLLSQGYKLTGTGNGPCESGYRMEYNRDELEIYFGVME
ncbi:hypothetical protein [Pedobacter agri]|uniref:Uncharacterized protein n=1 Tax=Pedobacter agri TaxID=454586 RepID=A0A9X3DCT6_9SPHI|nr:hypothetical protein [Pedobacter agri]MCX3264800.1 hypothetical protein [Pedobacter agri]